MRSSLPEQGLCLEPFGGSGATLIGAERTGRICYTMELQPMYVDVIVKRWQDFTGRDAIHSVSGKTFNELARNNG
jgi:DNA modification methylase